MAPADNDELDRGGGETSTRNNGAEGEADGYKPTRRHTTRDGGKSSRTPARASSETNDKKGPPPSAYRRFMDEHWESWLSQVTFIVVLGVGVIGYKMDYLREGMVGLVLAGGLLAFAIYSTVGSAYDLIESKNGRTLFAALAIVWAASVGYPTLRKAVPRKVLAEAVLTEQSKSLKMPIGENAAGPFDVTVSGSLRPEAGGDRKVDYALTIAADGGQSHELVGEFSVKTNQMRTRRGSTHWTQQNSQIEHRLPNNLRGHELSVSTEGVDELLQSGLHVAVHPQSLNPLWFLVTGILVVLAMIFVEAKIGDAKNKTHLIMASAATLVFAWHFSENATANRLVAPALDSLFLSLVTGGIGGTLVGAVVRRVSGRDRLKPKAGDERSTDPSEERASKAV